MSQLFEGGKDLGKFWEELVRMRKKCLQGSLMIDEKHLPSWLGPRIFRPEWLGEFFQPSGWMSIMWGLGEWRSQDQGGEGQCFCRRDGW